MYNGGLKGKFNEKTNNATRNIKSFNIIELLFLVIFLTLASSLTYSNEFVINGNAASDISGLTFSDGSKFRLFTSKGHCRASSGDYGLSDCYGTLENDKNDDVQFEVFYSMIAQDEESFIMKFYRNKGSQDVGTGKTVIVDAIERFKYILNANCNHAITYIKKDYFAIQKCKL